MRYFSWLLLIVLVGCASLRYSWNADQKRCRDRKTGQYVTQVHCASQQQPQAPREIIKP